ncbi:hypothetical protein [Borreliella valaisiana]|uniref:hypothetical protein n=1 Tax=Borreliella valaisiana TaxID=62088 RepID=UPI003B2247EE
MNQKQLFFIFLLLLNGAIIFSYDQSKYDGYLERYSHKNKETNTWTSYFDTFRNDDGRTSSTIFIGEDKYLSQLKFHCAKGGKEAPIKIFHFKYYYRRNFNKKYPLLYEILENISKIKVTLSFDNETEKITRELKEKEKNGKLIWELWNDKHGGEEIRFNLRPSDPGIENLLPKLLKHKTITITIEVPDSEDPSKLSRSMTFDLDNFQKLYNKYNAYFK